MKGDSRKAFVALFPFLGLAFALAFAPPLAVAQKPHKFAMILAGAVEDADYNFSGYQVVQDVQQHFKMSAVYSERVGPADDERVAREYIASGHDIINFYGVQYLRTLQKLAPQFPDLSFIIQTSGKPPLPGNVWNIRRFWPEAFHPFGVLAGMSTTTNKVGVIGGIPIPDFKGAINTIGMALKQVNPKAELVYAFTGNQNDPVKARQVAEAQIGSGVDFIITMVNLGVYGVIEAVQRADHPVLITSWVSDKADKAPRHFAGSLLVDFRPSTRQAMEGVLQGQKGGYIEVGPGTGFYLSKLTNVSPEAARATRALFDKMARGEVKLQYSVDEIILK
jgi:basic membrane lipoprotein Med (substrate-binding protein (PBP1-ABC) superfamily)